MVVCHRGSCPSRPKPLISARLPAPRCRMAGTSSAAVAGVDDPSQVVARWQPLGQFREISSITTSAASQAITSLRFDGTPLGASAARTLVTPPLTASGPPALPKMLPGRAAKRLLGGKAPQRRARSGGLRRSPLAGRLWCPPLPRRVGVLASRASSGSQDSAEPSCSQRRRVAHELLG